MSTPLGEISGLDPYAWLPWRLSEQRREQLSKAPTEWIWPVTNGADGELDKATWMARATADLDPRIARLASTSLCGQRLRRSQTADIQEIVTSLPLPSRTEPGHTVCQHLGWQTPRASNRIQLAMRSAGGTRTALDPGPARPQRPWTGPPSAPLAG